MSGYVRIHRTLVGHPAFRNDAEAMAFAWMVLRAAWKPCRVRYKERAIQLQRGQLSVSQRDMATALDRDKAWVERLWKRLRGEAMIEVTSEAGVAVITICNYEEYQASQGTGEAADEAPREAGARQGRGTEQRREERKKELDDADASSATAVSEAVAFWNEVAAQAGWPPIRILSDKRRKCLKARLAQHDGLAGWKAALSRAAASPLIGARPPPTWFTFDWVTSAGNFIKLIEGNYDRTWQSNPSPAAGRYAAALALIADGKSEGAGEDEGDHWGAGAEVPRLGWN